MNEHAMNKPTETDLALFDAMRDDQIDTSDIPVLEEDFFTQAAWKMPEASTLVMIEIEPDILAWFQAQGDDYQNRLAAALRLYVAAHRSFAHDNHVG